MPKGKRKGKSDRNGRQDGSGPTSDEDSVLDNASVISGFSEQHSTEDGDEIDELAAQEAFEKKILEALDGLTQKSMQGRTNCFESIGKAFTQKYIPDFVYDRRVTLCDCIERGLRKGKGTELAAAAQLAPLLCVQLGAGDASEEIYHDLKPILSTITNDNSVSPIARAKACWSISLLSFLACAEMGDILETMRHLQAIFAASFLKGDSSVPNVTPDMGNLHASALNAWTLLVTLMSPGDVYTMFGSTEVSSFTPSVMQLTELLTSPHLEVRLAAGEALATIFELGRICHDDFAEDLVPDLVEKLQQLATDSHKYRAKKDRKQQRATFRDVLHYIESDTLPDVQIRFNQETLILDSWTRRKQYDALCQTLGSGLNLHLAENELLRDIFQLGSKILICEGVTNKQTKQERHLLNAAAFKARTISRSKNRDKRSDF